MTGSADPAAALDVILALVARRVVDELRPLLAELAAPVPSPAPLVDRRELARLLGVSSATVMRLTAESMPCTHVGQSPRYDPAAVRDWLRERGQRGTRAAAPRRESIGGVRLLSRGR